MKMIKGILIGGAISAGVYMIYKDTKMGNKRMKMMKQGKKFLKNIGMI